MFVNLKASDGTACLCRLIEGMLLAHTIVFVYTNLEEDFRLTLNLQLRGMDTLDGEAALSKYVSVPLSLEDSIKRKELAPLKQFLFFFFQ